MIDFSEIKTPHRWEQFAEHFFHARGSIIIKSASLGQDGGADLIIEETIVKDGMDRKFRILVSCKYYLSQSVGLSIEKDILDRIIAHDCNGFYGFYSTNFSSHLQTRLNDIQNNPKDILQLYHIFDDFEIETFIKDNSENNLFKNYFELSYKTFIGNTRKRIDQNTNFKKLVLDNFRIKDREAYKEYYAGNSPTWEVIKKYTFKRDLFETIVSHLDKNKIGLLTAAGGEGKSTLMMQIGCHYFDKHFEVFYSFEGISNIDILELQFDKRKNYLLLIDQANYIDNLAQFVQIIMLKQNIKVLFASRKNEWLQGIESSKYFKELRFAFAKNEFSLEQLSKQEIRNLGAILNKYAIIHAEAKEDFDKKMLAESERSFLLATMLFATKGQKFEFYIADVINNIRKWENGFMALKAIGYIVAIEVLGSIQRRSIFCSEKLLSRLMDLNHQKYYEIRRHLAEEAFFQRNASRSIHTRNPLIAQLYFDILFNNVSNTFSQYDFYLCIIHECALISERTVYDILAMIPLFIRKNLNNELAHNILQNIISYGYFFRPFVKFIDDLVHLKNIGDYDTYSARWLCLRGSEKNRRLPETYMKWIAIEAKYGILGDFDTPYSVRWIFKSAFNQGVDLDQLYIEWALIEAKMQNVGNLDFEPEFSARWLFRERFHQKISVEIVEAWVNLEMKEKNIGNLNFEPEYSARWILKRAHDTNSSLDIFVTWARLEISHKNFGDLAFWPPFSARWILKKGIEKFPHEEIFTTWAKLEIKLNNVGDLNSMPKHSARWILKTGFELNISEVLPPLWAKLEVREGNIGDPLGETPNSARWILKHAISKCKNSASKGQLTIFWAKIEAQIKNFGDYQKLYSALYLIRESYNDGSITLTGYSIWSAIQHYLDVPDSDEFSSRKCFEKGKANNGFFYSSIEQFENFEDWKKYLESNDPEKVFRVSNIRY